MKSQRIKFKAGAQRTFIEELCEKSNLSTKELAARANITPRSFRDWKNEKLTMTEASADAFCRQFSLVLPEEKDVLIRRWVLSKKVAAKRGGISRFQKYGSFATVEGRKKGGRKAIEILRNKRIIPSCKTYLLPKAYSSDLAEFVGIMLGDGGLTPLYISITLNSEADQAYIYFVISLCEKLFGERPKIHKHRNDKAVALYYNSKVLATYFISIGLKVGSKVKQQVGVPEWIIKNKEYSKACLRGLMDTDGGIFLHRYLSNKKRYTYSKLCFSNRSIPLLLFVYETLIEFGFTPKLIEKVENKKVWLYNAQEVKQYLLKIGTNNQRLLRHTILT